MAPRFSHVPAFTPPFPPRPPKRVRVPKVIFMMAQDLLRPFEINAFSRSLTVRRVLGRDIFIFNSPELVREAMLVRHEALQRKTPQMRTALEPLIGDGLFVSDGPVWKERRTLIQPIVHARHISTFFPIMLGVAEEWRNQWWNHVGKGPVDILHEMGVLTAEVISRSVFGQRLGRKYTGEIVKNFAEYQRYSNRSALSDLFQLPSWVPRFQRREVKRASQRIHAVIDQIIDEHLKERAAEAERRSAGTEAAEGCPHQRAMIAQLFDAGEGGSSTITREQIRNEAIVLFMAGHETTANTLAWAFYLLSQSDWAREKLDAELKTVLNGRTPTLEDIDNLVYTRAVIEETLRLYPPVPILGREAMAHANVKGSEVDKGDIALVVPWLLHRNPNLWERPDDFVPERFLPDQPRPSKYQYVPFAIGPRVCPGLAFGLTEATLVLAVLAQAFELRLAPGVDVQPKTSLTLRPGDTLPMLIESRQVAAPAEAAE